jgi:hypothetical protein
MLLDFQAHDRVLEDIRQHDPNTVADGAVVPQEYAQSKPRLLWILRETNGGGDWDLRRFLSSDEELFGYRHWHATFGALAKISFGLIHNSPEASIAQMDAKDAVEALRSVAVVNVNKRGGESRVDWESFPEEAREFSSFVDKQINALAPDVIIAAGTADHLPARFDAVSAELGQCSIGAARLASGVHFVKSYHTAQTTLTHHALYQQVLASLLEAGWKHPLEPRSDHDG